MGVKRLVQAVFFAFAISAAARAQAVGSVAAADATVTTPGRVAEVSSGRLTLAGNSTVVAKDHSAPIALARGGSILLCRTSSLHLAGSADTLAIGMDRGAMEIRTKASASDAIVTPDLRITMPGGGPLDLRMRVSPDGDTCVENRGHKAPTLALADSFGESSYQVRPGQHVLFEHGSLKAVVDRETTPCGCPPDDVRAVPLAEAILHGNGGSVTPQQSAAANPFPAAQSEGLAPVAPLPADKPGEIHTQVSTSIAFDPAAKPAQPAPDEPVAAPAAPAPQPAAASGGGPLRAIGRFFKRIFVR